MYLAHIKGKPFAEEILPPIEDVHGDWFLRASTLEAVEIEPRAELIAQVELLTHGNVRSGTNEQADGSRSVFMIVHSPRSGEIEASAGLIVPDPVRCYGRILVEDGISRAKLQP